MAEHRYTAGQERLIKARFYRWVLHKRGGKWEQVSEDLEIATGCKIPGETLRQNIRPTNKKAGIPSRSFQDPKRLQALCDFVTAAGYLKHEELNRDTGYDALSAMQTFCGKNDSVNTQLWARLQGDYETGWIAEDYTASLNLSIHYNPRTTVVSATTVEVIEGLEDAASDERSFYEGWAVSNASGLVMFFLRNDFEETLHSYLLLQTKPSILGKTPVETIGLLKYESVWGGELKETVTDIDEERRAITYALSKSLNDVCFFLTRLGS
ncbi:MAG: hypothetical protein DBP01_05185 [gamma proteobacterium symbiont of Ctena orbiculata]|nr:MAG: hypothetical protein DBP01_05185 [gamma proteobacterium symbiont of Ctena orbiculata]